MATVLETGGGVETVVSEHSGRTFTSEPGKDGPSDAFNQATDHENEDYAEDREGLGVASAADKAAEEEDRAEYEKFVADRKAERDAPPVDPDRADFEALKTADKAPEPGPYKSDGDTPVTTALGYPVPDGAARPPEGSTIPSASPPLS